MARTAVLATTRKHGVRIRRSKIDKLACQAQSVRIFAEGEYPGTRERFLRFFDSEVFQNFADAFQRFAHLFVSVTVSNRHTLSEVFQKSFPFNFLQSHRYNGIL